MATVAIRIGPADNGRPMTIEEFLEAEEEPGYRYELARGVLEVTEVPNDPHGHVVCNLYDVASNYRRSHPGVIFRYGGGDVFRLWMPGMVSGRNPDLAIVVRGAIRDQRGRFKPTLVAEVVSKGSVDRDHRIKREEYLAFGLQEYWIIDFLARKMTLLVRNGDVWVERPCVEDQPIPSLVLPGLASTVAELWIDLDAYEEADFEEE